MFDKSAIAFTDGKPSAIEVAGFVAIFATTLVRTNGDTRATVFAVVSLLLIVLAYFQMHALRAMLDRQIAGEGDAGVQPRSRARAPSWPRQLLWVFIIALSGLTVIL